MSTTVQYKGNTLATVSNDTKTLKTAGKYMEGDVVLTDVSGGSGAISVVDTLDSHGGTIRTITAVDISDTTAVASDVAQGKYFYTADGTKTEGTSTGGGGGSSAELLQKWTYDKLIVEDEEITLPVWSSSSQTLKASANLSPSVNCDLDDYNYFYVLRCLAYPIYKNNDDYAGKTEYSIYVHCAQLMCLPADKISSKSGSHISSDYITVASASQVYCIYWLNNNTVNRTNTLYGGTFVHTYPTYTNGALTLKTPQLGMRGGSSYYSQTAYDNTDDIRFQYVIELYRTSKQDISVISLMSQVDHIVDNLNNNNWTLT